MSEGSPSNVEKLLAPQDIPIILDARQRTVERLDQARDQLKEIELDKDASIVLMGSWGRAELTSKSDDDFMVLFNGLEREDAKPSIESVHTVLGKDGAAPGREEIFGRHVWLDDLKDRLGPDDSNKNLTRRMLLLLESVAGAGLENHNAARQALIGSYLDANVKPYRPPRYFLNDVVRYWRTIAVDFEGKHRDRDGAGWGIRNAKLRLSRKALFAGGLLPLLRCVELETSEMADFLEEQFCQVPLERIAGAFIKSGQEDAGSRALTVYNEFLGILDDPEQRDELAELEMDGADDSELFGRIRELGQEFQSSLSSLLFDDEEMNRIVRDYLIF